MGIMLLFEGLTYSQSESPNNPTEIEIQEFSSLDAQGTLDFDGGMASFHIGELMPTLPGENRANVEWILEGIVSVFLIEER